MDTTHPHSKPTAAASASAHAPSSLSEVKPAIPEGANEIAEHYSDEDGEGDDTLDGGDGNGDSGEGSAKRPRLRLAHACDRCRKRKIRCDTQQPCGPCQATKNECTFHTPSRRTSTKPKALDAGQRSSSTSGVKRPHSPPRERDQTALEARLAALESMLRDVPPNVHNAFLSSLDARLGGGVGVGLKEGRGGDGVGVSPEALLASGSGAGGSTSGRLDLSGASTSALQQWVASATTNGALNVRGREMAGLKSTGMMGSSETLAPRWGSFSGGSAGQMGRGRRQEEGVDAMAKKMEGMSFFYEDEIGQAKWQGATSGFPLLLSLTAANVSQQESSPNDPSTTSPPIPDTSPPDQNTGRRSSSQHPRPTAQHRSSSTSRPRSSQTPDIAPQPQKNRFFPDRAPRPHQTLNPEASWKVITSVIPPDLMDTLVRCYLSTSHLLWPFLHVPSFLADYANPNQWGEPGFACFIVAVCTLSSRHVDDPRVRANPTDPSTAGKTYFELFKRLRDLPAADRPTLYSTQAAFLAAIYAFGLGNLSKAFALQAESVTLCLDGGLHRSVDGYDHFDAIEKETRKRTFWAIYSWDKQSAALFGRPPIIHLRDCDVTEPLIVDDDYLTPEGVIEQPSETKSRLNAFVAAIRLHVILEGVLDAATQPSTFPTSPFLARAAATIARRSTQHDLREEEDLLDEWERILPKYWQYDAETTGSRDPIRITQAERLHCLQHLVKMIIYRHRFSGFVVMPASTAEDRGRHLEMSRKAMQCALTIIADHVHISQRGMMTYYGVHVIHQLAQAGRTLVAVILNCRNADFRPLVSPAIEGLRSCVGLLRRFSGRYLCGLRSADIIDEFCRICNIPVDSPRVPDGSNRPSPAWLRPVQRRYTPSPGTTRANSSSPTAFTSGEDMMSAAQSQILPSGSIPSNSFTNPPSSRPTHRSGLSMGLDSANNTDFDALFNTDKYFNTMSPPTETFDLGGIGNSGSPSVDYLNGTLGNIGGGMSNPHGGRNSFTGSTTSNSEMDLPPTDGGYNDFSINIQGNGLGDMGMGMSGMNGMGTTMAELGQHSQQQQQMGDGHGQGQATGQGSDQPMLGSGLNFDFGGSNGFGGEMLAGEGMDSVSDGLKGGETQGLSAATILSLLEEGSFDYGAMFTDQAPLPMDFGEDEGI